MSGVTVLSAVALMEAVIHQRVHMVVLKVPLMEGCVLHVKKVNIKKYSFCPQMKLQTVDGDKYGCIQH
jgi:predicted Zn-ribbon and HTH transcriptional regulator